jgi:hypothetical protein
MGIVSDAVNIHLPKKLIILEKTRKIPDNEDLEEWVSLKEDYKKLSQSSWEDRAMVSMVNAILLQRRVVFILTRKNFRELLRNDRNWKKKIGIRNDNWRKLILTATNCNIIKCIHKPTNNSCGVYEVIHKDILKYLNVDVKQQRAECIDYVNQNHEDIENIDKNEDFTSLKNIENQDNKFNNLEDEKNQMGHQMGHRMGHRMGPKDKEKVKDKGKVKERRSRSHFLKSTKKSTDFLKKVVEKKVSEQVENLLSKKSWLLAALSFERVENRILNKKYYSSILHPSVSEEMLMTLKRQGFCGLPESVQNEFRQNLTQYMVSLYESVISELNKSGTGNKRIDQVEYLLNKLSRWGILPSQEIFGQIIDTTFIRKNSPDISLVIELLSRVFDQKQEIAIKNMAKMENTGTHPDFKVTVIEAPLEHKRPEGEDILSN